MRNQASKKIPDASSSTASQAPQSGTHTTPSHPPRLPKRRLHPLPPPIRRPHFPRPRDGRLVTPRRRIRRRLRRPASRNSPPQPPGPRSTSRTSKKLPSPPLIEFAKTHSRQLGSQPTRAISSVVERLLHTQEVAGSNPASRTIFPFFFSVSPGLHPTPTLSNARGCH